MRRGRPASARAAWGMVGGALGIAGASTEALGYLQPLPAAELRDAPAPRAPSLAGQSFSLRKLRGDKLARGTRITAHFDRQNMSGTSGCNRYTLGYGHGGGSFVATSHPSVTRRLCVHAEVMDQERAYLDALLEARSFTLTTLSLVLRDAEGKELLSFAPLAAPPR